MPADDEDTFRFPWHAKAIERTVHFFVALYHPLNVPDEFTFERQTPHPVGQVKDHPAFNPAFHREDGLAYSKIHYRFHQAGNATLPIERIEALLETAHDRAIELGWGHQESQETKKTEPPPSTTSTRWTIIEMSFHDPGIGDYLYQAQKAGEYPDWLSQCVAGLKELVRAFRIVARAPVAEANYQSLIPVVFTFEVAPDGRAIGDLEFWMLNSSGGMWVEAELDETTRPREALFEDLQRTAARLSANDPFMDYNDRVWRAERHLSIDGQYDLAILESAIAAEGLLFSTWLALQWEKNEQPVEAFRRVTEMTKSKPTKTILGWLGQELGGRWEPENCAATSDWVSKLQRWRNEIAHTNARFDRAEAVESLAITRKLAQFLIERLVARFNHFPKTAYLAGGARRINPRRLSRFLASVEEEPPLFISLTDWMNAGRAGLQ